jgi:hypothetical protein
MYTPRSVRYFCLCTSILKFVMYAVTVPYYIAPEFRVVVMTVMVGGNALRKKRLSDSYTHGLYKISGLPDMILFAANLKSSW